MSVTLDVRQETAAVSPVAVLVFGLAAFLRVNKATRYSFFLNWIPVWPPSGARAVIPIPVVEQVGFVVLVLGREPEGIGFGHWPDFTQPRRERIGFVTGAFAVPRRVYRRINHGGILRA